MEQLLLALIHLLPVSVVMQLDPWLAAVQLWLILVEPLLVVVGAVALFRWGLAAVVRPREHWVSNGIRIHRRH
jgi:hypothetical protein